LRHQKKLLCIWCVGPCRPCRESVFRFTIAGARAAGREGRKKAACSTNQTPPRRMLLPETKKHPSPTKNVKDECKTHPRCHLASRSRPRPVPFDGIPTYPRQLTHAHASQNTQLFQK